MIRTILLLFCMLCMSFGVQRAGKDIKIKGGNVYVGNQLYCMVEEPAKGSRSFNIVTPSGETVILASVAVENNLKNGEVQNYFNVKLLPSHNEFSIAYSKRFPEEFVRSLVAFDVLQEGIWNEYGARQMAEYWGRSNVAIANPRSNTFVENKALSEKLAKYNITCDTAKRIFVNDSLVYYYTARDNWTRTYQYRNGLEELYYRIYGADSNLQAEVTVRDHRSDLSTNVRMRMIPGNETYYFADIPKADEKVIIGTAVKMLIIKKWP